MNVLIERLRDASDGWTGDAACVPAEVGEEAADALTAYERLVEELIGALEGLLALDDFTEPLVVQTAAMRAGAALASAKLMKEPQP